MESSFFGGLLRGFGGGMLDAQVQQQRTQADHSKELLDFLTRGVESNALNPEVAQPLIAGILGSYMQGGTRGRGKQQGLAGLFDPNAFSQVMLGAMQGSQVAPGQPMGGVGPAPMGRTNAPEQRPESIPPGLMVKGNIDLTNRPQVQNPDGSVSTIRSMSFGADGREILVPTVSEDGRILTDEEAIQQFQDTGRHLGIFDTPDNATAFAQKLHEEQELTGGRPFLEGRSTTVAPRPTLFNTPREQQRLNTEALTAKQAATTEGADRGRIRVAEELLRTGKAKTMDEALTRVGLGVPRTTAEATRYQEGNILPDPKSPTGYSQQLYNPANPSDIRTIPAPGPRMVEGNIVPDPMSATGWSQEVYDPTDPTRKYRIPAPDPLSRSTRAPTDADSIAYELFGKPGEDPRSLRSTPGRLTNEQFAKIAEVQRERITKEAADTTAAREEAQRLAKLKELVPPDDAAANQVPFGTTYGQLAELNRMGLTPRQREAAASMMVFETELTDAEALFEKVWPRVANPEQRRLELASLQRGQYPDFVRLQALLKGMPSRLAVMAQTFPISNRDIEAFQAQIPKTAPDEGNWGIIDVPTSYEAGKALLAQARNMIKVGRTASGIVPPNQRNPVRTAPGTTIDSRGNVKRPDGTIISGPDKPR